MLLIKFIEFYKIQFLNSTNVAFKKCDFRAVQRSAFCRSRRELSNAYSLSKFGFDTAENEPSEVCRIRGLGRSCRRPRGCGRRSPTSSAWSGSRAAICQESWRSRTRAQAVSEPRLDLDLFELIITISRKTFKLIILDIFNRNGGKSHWQCDALV